MKYKLLIENEHAFKRIIAAKKIGFTITVGNASDIKVVYEKSNNYGLPRKGNRKASK